MDKIQEAFDKYLIAEGPIDGLEGAFCDKNEEGKESFKPSFWDVCNAFYNGYKAAEKKYRGAVLVAEEYRKRLEAIEGQGK